MQGNHSTYKIIFSLIILTISSFYTQCIFQKGGVDTSTFIQIFIITLMSIGIMNYTKQITKDIIFILILTPILILLALLLQLIFIHIVYKDKTWLLWEFKHRTITNIVFYGTVGISLMFTKVIRLKIKV